MGKGNTLFDDRTLTNYFEDRTYELGVVEVTFWVYNYSLWFTEEGIRI